MTKKWNCYTCIASTNFTYSRVW